MHNDLTLFSGILTEDFENLLNTHEIYYWLEKGIKIVTHSDRIIRIEKKKVEEQNKILLVYK